MSARAQNSGTCQARFEPVRAALDQQLVAGIIGSDRSEGCVRADHACLP